MSKSNSIVNNRLVIVGDVISEPKRYKSPSGIEHCRFYLEHCSEKQEVSLRRSVWCKLPVQISGSLLTSKTQSITVGCKLQVIGFIHSHKTANGLMQLVLHAEKVEFID